MAETKRLIVVMAFGRSEDGDLLAVDEGTQCQSEHQARSLALDLSRKHAGVIAWSREAFPEIGEYGDPVELARYGDVPDLD